MSQLEINQQKPLYQVKNYGSTADWGQFHIQHPRLGPVSGKQFLRDDLGFSGMEISLNSLAPGKSAPFVHGHKKNEEAYLIVSGQGQFMLGEAVVEVSAGTVIRVAPPVLRCWRNTGTVPLVYVVIQAQEGSLEQATARDGFISDQAPIWPTLTT